MLPRWVWRPSQALAADWRCGGERSSTRAWAKCGVSGERGERGDPEAYAEAGLEAVEGKVEEVEACDAEGDGGGVFGAGGVRVPVAQSGQRGHEFGEGAGVRDGEGREDDEGGRDEDVLSAAEAAVGVLVGECADEGLDDESGERSCDPDERGGLLREAEGEEVRRAVRHLDGPRQLGAQYTDGQGVQRGRPGCYSVRVRVCSGRGRRG